MSRSIKLYSFLCSLFCTIVITGNLIFQKFVTINILSLEFELSVGVLLYQITFLISDLTAEFYGNRYANHMIKTSVLCSFIVMGLIMISDYLPATNWSNIDDVSFHKMLRWLYFRGQILYKDLKLKKYYYDKEKEFLFA